MALRKPSVFNPINGEFEVIQPGDYIQSTDIPTYTNADATSHIPGQVVFSFGAGSIKKAKADAGGTMPVIALATTTITNGVSGSYQSDGTISLTTAQWDAVAGTTGGLTVNTPYFVSAATAGLLTATPPTTGYCQAVIRATSTTDAIVSPRQAIKL